MQTDEQKRNLVRCVEHFIKDKDAKKSVTEFGTHKKLRINGEDFTHAELKNKLYLFADRNGYTENIYPGFSDDLVKQFFSSADKVVRS